MYGYGHDKKKYFVKFLVVPVLLCVKAGDAVHVWSDEVEDVKEKGTEHDTKSHNPPYVCHLECGHYQPES